MTSKLQKCPKYGEEVEDSFISGWDHVIKKHMLEGDK